MGSRITRLPQTVIPFPPIIKNLTAKEKNLTEGPLEGNLVFTMALVIALGSNEGRRKFNIDKALSLLRASFTEVQVAQLYESLDIYNPEGPPFLNTVAQYVRPEKNPRNILNIVLNIEKTMGRKRLAPKGPRVIDLDILFINDLTVQEDGLTLPHPRWAERSFVVRPLSELPCFDDIKFKYPPKISFPIEAHLYRS